MKQRARIKKTDEKCVSKEENTTKNLMANTGTSPMIPKFSSPVTPTSRLKLIKNKASTNEHVSVGEILDGSEIPVLSQHLTPSKWSSYIPDFSSSQKDEVNCEVLWDFSSPDAVRHLRRRKANDSNVKEFLRFFKEPPSKVSKTPPLLNIWRDVCPQQNVCKNLIDSAKQESRLVRKQRSKGHPSNEHAKDLLCKILSAVENKSDQSVENTKDGKLSVTPPPGQPVELHSSAGSHGDDSSDISWSDDELFQENSFILQATQNPDLFLDSCTSDAINSAVLKHQEISLGSRHNLASSSLGDDSGIIPPTLAPKDINIFRETRVFSNHSESNKQSGVLCSFSKTSPIDLKKDVFIGNCFDADNTDLLESPRSRFQTNKHQTNWRRSLSSPVQPLKQITSFGPTEHHPAKCLDKLNLIHTVHKMPKDVYPTRHELQATHLNQQNQLTIHCNQPTRQAIHLNQLSSCVTNSNSRSVHPRPGLNDVPLISSGLCGLNHNQLGLCDVHPNQCGSQAVHSNLPGVIHNHLHLYVPPVSSGPHVHISQPVSHSAHPSKLGLPPSNLTTEMLDTSLSDEVLLQLTKADDFLDSQTVQEFPTPVSTKWQKPMDESNDSVDLDHSFLPLIDMIEYVNSPQSESNFVNSEKYLVATVLGQNSDWNGKCKSSELEKIKYLKKNVSNKLAFNQCNKLLGSKAHCISTNHKSEIRKAPPNLFKFRPLADSASNLKVKAIEVTGETSSEAPSVSFANIDSHSSCLETSIHGINSIGCDEFSDLEEEESLFQTQILAMLEQVESQASQKLSTQSQAVPCSQEEIEKKRQIALQKKFQASTIGKGKFC